MKKFDDDVEIEDYADENEAEKIVDAMQRRKHNASIKKILATLVISSMVVTGLTAYGIVKNNSERINIDNTISETAEKEEIDKDEMIFEAQGVGEGYRKLIAMNPELKGHIYFSNGYFYCNEDYVRVMSKKAINEIKVTIIKTLKDNNCESDIKTNRFLYWLNSGVITPELITAIALQESSYRFADKDGNTFVNNTGIAYGMTQGKTDTFDTIDNYNIRLNNSEGFNYGFSFNTDSVCDPYEALKFTTFYFCFSLTFNKVNEPLFNDHELARDFAVYSYLNGTTGAQRVVQAEGNLKSPYVNSVLKHYDDICERYDVKRAEDGLGV